MLAFSVTINDEPIGICGFQDWSILSATLTAGRGYSKHDSNHIEFRVGGLERGSENKPAHHLRHILRQMNVGDKIEVEIVDSDNVMEPKKRYRSDREVQESPFTEEEMEQMDREAYEELKARFEPDPGIEPKSSINTNI